MPKDKATESFYAVRRGRLPGIYKTWTACRAQVDGYKGAIFKKFPTEKEAQDFLETKQLPQLAHGKVRPKTTQQQDKGDIIIPVINSSTAVDDQNEARDGQKETFNLEDRGDHIVYTDGASSNNGRACAVAGYGVFWGDNDPRNLSEPLEGKQTNQRAEIMAVIRALEQSLELDGTLEIRTDSQYVINCADVWSKKWKKNGWKSSETVGYNKKDGKAEPRYKDVSNKDLLQRLVALRESREKMKGKGKVYFTYVPGHKNVYGNEMADRLAVSGAVKSSAVRRC